MKCGNENIIRARAVKQVAYRGDVALHLKFIIGFNNDAHQWSVHMRLLMPLPSRMFWISHFVGERTPRECVPACGNGMKNENTGGQSDARGKGYECPATQQHWLHIGIRNLQCWSATSQIFTSIRISSFALQRLYGHTPPEKMTTATTSSYNSNNDSDTCDCERKKNERMEAYMMIRYCIRFRHSSEWLGIVWNGTWGWLAGGGKEKWREKHIFRHVTSKRELVSWAHAVI